MSGLTKSKGNMYSWTSHTFSHLGGECSHGCRYCFVQAMAKRFPNMKKRYSGDIHIIEGSLDVKFGEGKTIFIDHLNDLFADEVPAGIIQKVTDHCAAYPGNTYVFQSKNPRRMLPRMKQFYPVSVIAGTTIESNRMHECMGNAPLPFRRVVAMESFPTAYQTFITIEPILKFDLDVFADMIIFANPSFVNIGADSKGHGLPEPSYEEIMALYKRLTDAGIEVRKKINLERLEKKSK